VRALTFVGPRQLEWREVAEPTLQGPGEALVCPVVASTCDLDGAVIRGSAPFSGPFALGHEFVADVVDVGPEVRSVAAGSRVCVPFSISCGSCEQCRRGVTASCRSVPAGAMYGIPVSGDWGGCMSDLVRVPYADAMLVPLPQGVAPEVVVSISDNLADGWRTVATHLAERPGADVLVVGGGAPSISLYAVHIARVLGAGRVEFVDTSEERLGVAERLGAQTRQGPPPRRMGSFPITVDASADKDGLACALRSTESSGVCTSVGIYYEETTPVPLLEMFSKGVTFITSRASSRALMPAILDAVASGRLHPELVTSRVVAWDDAVDALLETPTKLVMTRA